MPFPRQQMREPQQPPAVRRDTVTPRPGALTLSHPLQGHKIPVVPWEQWTACAQPQLCAGCCHLSHAWGGSGSSKAQGDRESRLGMVEWPYKKPVLIVPNHNNLLV